ncbi:hypothetical protein SAMN04515620_13738 [Collimonas sp. OK607]|nr:hypothetical protein SAMN04515620_13738 [Collimonas sp. OK607]
MHMGAMGVHIKRRSADASPGDVDTPLLRAKSTGFLQLVTKCQSDTFLKYFTRHLSGAPHYETRHRRHDSVTTP